jgi:threonine synthase
MLRAIRESNGFAIAVDDDAILRARAEVARHEGLLLCPESAATYAAYKDALASGRVSAEEAVVLFNCASGLKYELPANAGQLDCTMPIDYDRLGGKP